MKHLTLTLVTVFACSGNFETQAQQELKLSAGALQEFQTRINGYQELRKEVESKLPTLDETADPAKISTRERDLGIAIAAARPAARQGDIFTPAVIKEFRRIIQADIARRTPQQLAGEFEEVPLKEPQVNTIYPTSEPLATLPPLLLTHLPTLPDPLEYRFMGRSLILRDGKANLIVDFIPGVIHRRG